MKRISVFLVSLLFVIASIQLSGRNKRVNQIPNGQVNACANCHVNPAGGGTRNAFGQEVEANYLTASGFSGDVEWGPSLALLDSDGDGVSNGMELQDPFGLWQIGDEAPGEVTTVTLPGVSTSTPALGNTISMLLKVKAMEAHIGELFELRIVDVNTVEVFSQSIASIQSPEFNLVFLSKLEKGMAYHLDIYTDHNGNGQYDAPPVDHAWRVELPPFGKDTTVTFFHNTNFTDIDWPVTAIDLSQNENPDNFVLEQNYPNPFNPVTTITFKIPQASAVELIVYDVTGKYISHLISGSLHGGVHSVQWKGMNDAGIPVASGAYIYHLKADHFSAFKQMIYLK